MPDAATSIEQYGTGVVALPFEARLRRYIRAAELPLWNPDQGLGEPFAAQGDGSPYFPVEIVRVLVPYQFSNYVSVSFFYVSAIFLYLFLRGLGLSEWPSILGSLGFIFSGAVTLHIPRPNIADQMCMAPVLFWAAAKAVRERLTLWYVVFAAATALNLVAGFIQIAILTALLVAIFCLLYTCWVSQTLRDRLRDSFIAIGSLTLGHGLAAFQLLPVAEALRISFNKNTDGLAFIPMPYANILSFFDPILFGRFFQSWVPGHYPNVTDWNNLYAYTSIGVLLLMVIGWASVSSQAAKLQVRLFLFFSLAGVVMLLRYISFPIVSGMNVLPVLGRQSPKHANGLTVFCFAIAAAFAAEWVIGRTARSARLWIVVVLGGSVTSVMTLITEQGGFRAVDAPTAKIYVGATLVTVSVLLVALWWMFQGRRVQNNNLGVFLTASVIGELSLYVPLGNGSSLFLWGRIGMFLLVAGGGLLLAVDQKLAAAACGAAMVVSYGALVMVPATGLPRQFDLEAPPPFMSWLKNAAGDSYRSFGIVPDYSSLAGVQDIGVVGPLSTNEFSQFVGLISSGATTNFFRSSSTFSLTQGSKPEDVYNLQDYVRAKPLFDWFGIRYLVLDQAFFNPDAGRKDGALLATPAAGVSLAYRDGAAAIWESPTAQSRAFFTPAVRLGSSQTAILEELRNNPSSILGPPFVEAGAAESLSVSKLSSAVEQTPVQLDAYTPNDVSLTVQAPSAGLVVLKDSYFPGWSVNVNGKQGTVVRVNGVVRGVAIPAAGVYHVNFVYRPSSFVRGLILAGAIAVFMLGSVIVSWAGRRKGHASFRVAVAVSQRNGPRQRRGFEDTVSEHE